MSSKPWRDREVLPPNPQKIRWTQKKIFDVFEAADELRNALKSEGCLVKVKRCGPSGSKFKVVTGTELSKSKKSKKEKQNATEQ